MQIRPRTALIPVVLVLACSRTPREQGAQESVADDVEAISLLGKPLRAPKDTSAPASTFFLGEGEAFVDTTIAWGRRLAAQWRFREAVGLYSAAIEAAPENPLLYRHRGHRLITLRRFESAAADLDRGHALDSTSFDIEYHRGLAYFLLGRFDEAAEIYARCMAQADSRARRANDTVPSDPRLCADIAIDDDSRVAIADWRYRALRRAGRGADATALLATIGDGMRVRENHSYYENLRRYAGRATEAAVLEGAGTDSVRLATSGYAMANWRLVEGDTAGARTMLERVASSPHWPAFAVIAAEADLVRLDPSRARRSAGRGAP